jgi:hypothetical protein
MNVVLLVLSALFCNFVAVLPTNIYSGFSSQSFAGPYTKFNPYLQGGGIISGNINYQPAQGAFQLQFTLTGQTFSDNYEFIPPFPSAGLATQCTPDLVNTYGSSAYWNTPINFPSTTGAPASVSAATGASICASATSSSTCSIGTRIYAVSSSTGSTTSITYKIDRYDDAYPPSTCGCAVRTFCIPIPSCVACDTSVSVSSGASLNCTSSPACGAVSSAAEITISSSTTSFTVSMPSSTTSIGFGPVAVLGASQTTPVNCPTAVHTCALSGAGISKYRSANCSGVPTCEVDDISDWLLWPLWYNPDYYNPFAPVDGVMSLSGSPCMHYTSNGVFTGTNLVTDLFIAGSSVCGWYVASGDQYTMTTYTSPAPALNFQNNCTLSQCLKPLDIVFIVELSSAMTFQDQTNIINYFLHFTDYDAIGAQLTNIGVVSYSPNGVQVALSQGVNLQQLAALDASGGGLSCCNTYAGVLTAPCCSGPSGYLSAAIRQAANLLAEFPFRTYTSKNIVLLTFGQFTDSLANINAALAYASNVTKARSTAQNPPSSAILNFDSLYFGSSQSVLNTLNSVKLSNDVRNDPLYYSGQLSTVGLQSGFDTVVNRVWNRPSTNYINYNSHEIFGGLCASNGGRSCGACCGECGCGVFCSPPNSCKNVTCYNVSLYPTPVTSSTCCNYQLYSCPGATINLCNIIQCDLSSGQCTNRTKTCPAANACYNYQCNPTTGNCDPIAQFSDPNACYQAYCTASNTVAFKPKVVCNAIPCYTVWCDNATGSCLNSSNPTTAVPCQVQSCVGNSWVWNYPSSCNSSNLCLAQMCDANTNQCYMGSKCAASDSCNNVTCNPSVGTCTAIGCPPNPIVNGAPNMCLSSPTCTIVANASLYSTCRYTTKVCTPSDPICQSASCNTTTGACVTTDLCPPYLGGNLCMPRLPGQCSNSTGSYVCNYTNYVCPNPGLCTNNTCNPTTGTCNYPNLCSAYQNNNYCNPLNTSSCSNGNGCIYNNITCTPLNICSNTTCVGTSTKTCPLPDVCPLYYGNTNKCLIRVNASCVNASTTGCSYTATNCTPADPCMTSTCQTKTGVCTTPTAVCALYLNNNKCYLRNNATCNLAPNCNYTLQLNCTGPNAWTTSTCATSSSGGLYCSTTQLCPTYQNGNNYCSQIANYVNGTCQYNNVTCTGSSSSYCSYLTCVPSIGCTSLPFCPNSTTNLCNFSTTCNGTCSYQTTTCPSSGDSCSVNYCNPSTGACATNITCPQYKNGNMCMNRTSCSPCNYQNTTCVQPQDPCQVATCSPSTGQCSSAQICSLYQGNNMCFPRNNNSCASGTCNYSSVLTTCAVPSQPCYYATCSSGNCGTALNSSFTVASCPASTSPCYAVQLNTSDPTCCSLVSNCTAPDACHTSTCSSSTGCQITPTCPAINPVNACSVYTGCAANGTCQYGPKSCGVAPVACQAPLCDAGTGICSWVDTSACVDPCNGITCSPVNCSNTACVNGTCVVVSNPPLCPTNASNYCAVGTCSPVNNFCTYTPVTADDCLAVQAPNPCFYWGTNPTFPGCCQQLPLCNTQTDEQFKCMLLTCNSDTNGSCALVDNTNVVCPPFFNSDYCQPLISCDNATGACTYNDLNVYCNNVTAQNNPCQDGFCNSSTGLCYSVNTTRCYGKCYNVVCQQDYCSKYVCNETDGECYLNSTTVCQAIDNCTTTECDPNVGCVPVPFNLTTCNNTDPCITVYANGSKNGCCDTTATCPPNADTFCNPVFCTNGTCSSLNGSQVCPPYQFNTTTNSSNLCYPYSGCSFGCLYSAVPCPASNVTCLIPSCNAATGVCNYTDTCRNDKCVTQQCNRVTGTCDTLSVAVCTADNCTNQTCVPALGCVTQTSVNISQCNSTNCTVPVLNPLLLGCCDQQPSCTSSSPCTVASCLPNGTCVYTPACPLKKCVDVSCTLSSSGTAQCLYANKTCNAASICEYVPPCVEDGKPYVCAPQSVCAPSNNSCYSILCNSSAVTAAGMCYQVPTVDCNDNNNCTVDACVNGNCTHTVCPYTDLCFPQACNASNFSCYVNAVNCNDNNACTNDTCVNGNCSHPLINCDDENACTVDYCDVHYGCVHFLYTCLLNESCAYDVPSDPTKHALFLEGVLVDPCSKEASVTSCSSLACINQTCVFTQSSCNVYFGSTEIVATTLGAAALAGICIAVVVIFGLAGGGTYAAIQKNKNDENAQVINNPLFRGKKTSGNNPMYTDKCDV